MPPALRGWRRYSFEIMQNTTTESVQVLIDVLSMLGSRSKWQELELEQDIPTAQVLAIAWNKGRLERCRQQLKEGTIAPAIDVSRFWVGDRCWYILGDGNHRTVAAREVGNVTIEARIGGECRIDVSWFVVGERILWQRVQPRVLQQVCGVTSVEQHRVLAELGVEEAIASKSVVISLV